MDKGAIRIVEPVFKGERRNDSIDEGQEEINPNYDMTKPNRLVFKYHQPSNVQPTNIPDKELHPEYWRFYDVDLDKVRAELAKNISLTGGLPGETPQQFRAR